MYLTSVTHRDELFEIATRWLADRPHPEDGRLLTEIFLYEPLIAAPVSRDFLSGIQTAVHGAPRTLHRLRSKDELIAALDAIKEAGYTAVAHGGQAWQDATIFAQAALEVRYGEDWARQSPVRPGQLLDARRTDDRGTDLWVTFNRVQENLLKGGLLGRARSGRRVRTRQVRSVTEDIRLNRALWRLAERFAQLKAA